ncbi:MAG TPA: hypothetical protein PK253_09340 [Spirochaetota bacterium]|nr:hypothetical protein [Spirochaetota bacterium]
MKGINISISGKLVLVSLIAAAVLAVLAAGDVVSCNDNRIMPIFQGSDLEGEKWSNERPLRVAIYPGGGFAAGILENNGLTASRESKFYKNHKLLVDFIIVEESEECMKLLAEKKIDVVWGDLQHFSCLYARYRSINPVAFMQYSWSAGEHAVITKNISSIRGLKGKKALCVEKGVSHFLALYVLRCNDIATSEITWKFTYTDSDANSLFSREGYSMRAVSRLINADSKGTVLVSTRQADRLIPGVFIAREQDLHVNTPYLLNFFKGWMEGVHDLREKREPAETLLASSYKVSPEKAKMMLDYVYPVDTIENMEFFGLKGVTLNGFSELYDLAEDIWINAGFKIGHGFSNFAKDTCIITSAVSDTSITKSGTGPAVKYTLSNTDNLKPLCSGTVIDFDKDSLNFSFSMKNRLKDFAMEGARFSSLPIRIDADSSYPGEPINAYRWTVRIRNILEVLAEFGIDRNRCYVNKMGSVPVPDQNRAGAAPVQEHVRLTLVSGESLQK